jgi:hypothetical protein
MSGALSNLQNKLDEANTRHFSLCDIPRYCSGNRGRLRTMADLLMACWSTATRNFLVQQNNYTLSEDRARETVANKR